MSADNDEHSGRPSTGTTTENVAKVWQAILGDQRRIIHDARDIIKLSYGTCQRKRPVKWHNNTWALNHDNGPAHTSLPMLQLLNSTKTTVISHPPYSPDLTPCDFFLFLKMKLNLKGWSFEGIEEIQTKLQVMLKMLIQNDFQQCFRSW
jgi:hypothetical protein